ncbi:MFS transporter [Halococcus thailandensis]|uniref:Nitrate/nitrite extrusion protein n=1 Tax=Halococcus thailandensis JCM 13552 TaxID=1227457 RepID=M0N224_9EURY|nr:MFS transporter [Halococcus thailandensis]EMA51548.1 nitrate/nitrite extrusion protein [Halococcus thailandensis JCM 13552]
MLSVPIYLLQQLLGTDSSTELTPQRHSIDKLCEVLILEDQLALTGIFHGLLLSSPHLSKAVLRIPFGAWVDDVGGKKPFLILMASTLVGTGGLVVTLFFTYPENFDMSLYPLLVLFGLLAGAGGATFSVGTSQTSYWYPSDKQGFALGAFAGIGNIGPGMITLGLPVLIGLVGLTGSYTIWLVFMLVATVIYALYAVDPYYFQLRKQGTDSEESRRIADDLGQDIFPSGGAWDSLKTSAKNRRTWVLVFLYTVSFGGGFTSLSAWFPTYWAQFHELSLATAGLLAGLFIAYGSLIRVPAGSISDRFGGEIVAIVSFAIMALGSVIMTVVTGFWPAIVGMMVLGTGMGIANAAVFELVPKFVPEAVGGASGWISGIGGGGTLVILPLMGYFADAYGEIGYARGFGVFVVLSLLCVGVAITLKYVISEPDESTDEAALH